MTRAANDKRSAALVGEHLRVWRLRAGVSQKNLAAAVGVSFQQMHKWESGVNRLSVDRLAHITAILKLDPAEVGRAVFAWQPDGELMGIGRRHVRAAKELVNLSPSALQSLMETVKAAPAEDAKNEDA